MNEDPSNNDQQPDESANQVSNARYFIFKSLFDINQIDSRYTAENSFLCDTDKVDFVSVAFHPDFKDKILQQLSQRRGRLSEGKKEGLLDSALRSIDNDLEAMRNNLVPPSAAWGYKRKLTLNDLKDACDLEREVLPDQEGFFVKPDENGEMPTIFNGKHAAMYTAGILRNKDDFNKYYVLQGRQGNTAEDIENWLVEWTDEDGKTFGFTGLGTETPSAATNTSIKPTRSNPDEYELDNSRITGLLGAGGN